MEGNDMAIELILERIETTSITIPLTLRDELKSLKIIPEEPWYKVIQRLVNDHKKKTILKNKK
jgi:hypothetical protein